MPAINFQQRFAIAVQDGIKRQSIRPHRKRPFVTGDKLMLYTGMRTKQCHFLRESTAIAVTPILIEEDKVWLAGVELDNDSVEELASADGFESVDKFIDFFRSTHG